MRKQNEDVDAIQALERLDRRGARIAGRRADDGGAQISLFEHMIHHAPEELHRQILEGERRPVKKFENEEIVGDLRQRRDRRGDETRYRRSLSAPAKSRAKTSR